MNNKLWNKGKYLFLLFRISLSTIISLLYLLMTINCICLMYTAWCQWLSTKSASQVFTRNNFSFNYQGEWSEGCVLQDFCLEINSSYYLLWCSSHRNWEWLWKNQESEGRTSGIETIRICFWIIIQLPTHRVYHWSAFHGIRFGA